VLVVLILLIALILVFPGTALAHCPLCVVGAGAGLSISRFLGIDDAITGVWIAALLGASSLWMARLIKKEYIPQQEVIIYITTFALTLWSFYAFNLADGHMGTLFGVTKITFGIIVGGVVFYLIEVLNALIKKIKGKVLFPYQPIVFSLGAMVILSLLIHVLVNYAFF
jgi:hypothetical protein